MTIWGCKKCGKIMGEPKEGVNPEELFHICNPDNFDGIVGRFEKVIKCKLLREK